MIIIIHGYDPCTDTYLLPYLLLSFFKSNDTLLINFLLFDVTIIFLGTSQILDAFLCCAILYSTGHGLYLTHWYAPLSTQYSFDHIVGTK